MQGAQSRARLATTDNGRNATNAEPDEVEFEPADSNSRTAGAMKQVRRTVDRPSLLPPC